MTTNTTTHSRTNKLSFSVIYLQLDQETAAAAVVVAVEAQIQPNSR